MTNYTGEMILSPVFIPADRAVMLDPKLSKGAKELYCALRSFLRVGEKSTIKYVITLAEMLHKCERAIQYALAELHKRGIIERRFRYRSNGDRRRNLPSEFVIIGGDAPCYAGNSRDFYKKISPSGEKNCTPIEDLYFSDNSITINREVELPEEISATEKKSEEEIRTSEISASEKAEERPVRENPSDSVTAEVPDMLKTTALYLLMRSGRSSLSPQEIKILNVLFKTHTPVRIQKEIDTAVERFNRKGKNLRCLSFNYIGKALENQVSLKPKKVTATTPSATATPKKVKTVRKNKMTVEEAKKVIAEATQPIKVPEKKIELFNIPKDISLLDYLRLKFPEEEENTFYRDIYLRESENVAEKRAVEEAYKIDAACSNCQDPEHCSLPPTCKKGRSRPILSIRTHPGGVKYLYAGYGGRLACKFEQAKEETIDGRLMERSGLTSSQVRQTFEAHEKTSSDVLIAEAEALKAAKNKTSLILAGRPGTGKTHLASAIAIEAMKNGRQAIFKVVPELLDELRQSAMERHDFFGLLQKYKDVPCLVLDDLGKEKTTRAGLDYLYQIIDFRYRHNLQTIITTNALAPEGLYNQWNVDVIEPLISRILEKGEWVTIADAKDYRRRE